MEGERLLSAEEGTLYSPVHSRGFLITPEQEDRQMVLRDTQWRFRKVMLGSLLSCGENYSRMSLLHFQSEDRQSRMEQDLKVSQVLILITVILIVSG